jgi:pimeloyl-ACP methyl ester carboxylesterase
MLFELLDDLRAKGFPTEQTTLGGFSQGCLMTVDVGLRYPHRFAGLVGISGWVFDLEHLNPTPLAKQQRLLMTHGTADPVIPIEKVRSQIPSLKAAGTRSKAKPRWRSSVILFAPAIPLLWADNRRVGEPQGRADLGRSNLHRAVRAGHPDLFRARLGCGLPVHRVLHGLAHFGKPPVGAGDASFAFSGESFRRQAAETEFELFVVRVVCCHI